MCDKDVIVNASNLRFELILVSAIERTCYHFGEDSGLLAWHLMWLAYNVCLIHVLGNSLGHLIESFRRLDFQDEW